MILFTVSKLPLTIPQGVSKEINHTEPHKHLLHTAFIAIQREREHTHRRMQDLTQRYLG